tara:strand:+ start:54 stop:335 length:282 start_codon:yes stop_codon:yes gene_type:complete
MTKKNIVDVSLCPSCQRLTTMTKIKGDKYFCRICRQSFKQFKNGKLIYIPLAVADAIERTKEQLKFEFEMDPQLDMEMGMSFEPEFEDDLDKD